MRCVSCGFVRLAAVAALAIGPVTTAWASEAATWEAAASLASSPAPPGLRLVWHEGVEDPSSTLEQLQRAGFRVEIALPPHVFYVREASPPRSGLPAGFAYRGEATRSLSTGTSGLDLFQGREDALPPLSLRAIAPLGAARSVASPGLPFGAKWKDTSEFMIGRIAVGIFFPESDGTTDPNR